MKETTERLSPGRVRTAEERVIDAMHRFAYSVVGDYARPTDRLLEIGFGEGYGSEIVGPWVAEYVGVEVDAESVAHADAKYRRPNTSFVLSDGARLDFDDGSFDLAISFQVLEHVDDPLGFLREAQRVTRPGGVVLVVTPNRNHRLAAGERPWNRYHVREFSPSELRDVMQGVFEKVELFGLRGSETMNDIEKRRVAKARRLARLDPLGLRYVLPESVDTKLRSALRRLRGSRSAPTSSDIGVEHAFRTSEDVGTSLDLLAVGHV